MEPPAFRKVHDGPHHPRSVAIKGVLGLEGQAFDLLTGQPHEDMITFNTHHHRHHTRLTGLKLLNNALGLLF